MLKRLAILMAVTPALLTPPSLAHEAAWVPTQGGHIPTGAWAAGYEQSKEALFACRAEHAGGLHIGKIRSQFGGCNIPYGGKEIRKTSYEVLVLQSD